jgi:pimeloyl-ACP methyl ester carboxylesterase/DNA-binding CsgD family transcriptional regulator
MPLRQQIRFCAAPDGVRLAYALSGAGPPMLKVGNWLSHLEYDFTNPVWGHLLDALSAGHTVVRYDQRGTGLSDRDVSAISFDAWVNDLETVIDASGVRSPFPIIGISQGASIGIAYAVRHPERVSHLVLHGGYARGRRKRGGGAIMEEESETFAKMAELGWSRSDSSFRQFFTNQFLPQASSDQQRWFNELSLLSVSAQTTGRMIREFDRIDVTHLLGRVRCPTLVLHASRDLRVPFDEGRLIASSIPGARFVPLDSAYHLMLADDPAWPHWRDEVRSFLGAEGAALGDARFAALTPRERELLDLIARGRDNTQLCALLQLSQKTIRNHITSIFAKLQVENRAQAIVLAREAGFGSNGEANGTAVPPLHG